MSNYTNPTAIRDAYRLVDDMRTEGELSESAADILLNALKPIPAQMSWDELRDYIQEGYERSEMDEWSGDMMLEAWMEELLCQYDGLKSLPAKPAHPEFLETLEDYNSAPEGTIVARDKSTVLMAKTDRWPGSMALARRRVLRWGTGEK